MGKVVTSAGLNEFVTSGTPTETIKSQPKQKPAAQAPPLEVKDDKPIKSVGEKTETALVTKAKPAAAEAPDEDLLDDEATRAEAEKSETLREAINRKNATINRKHREMREAQEGRQEAEEFAKTQWNEKRLAEERAERLERELSELKAKAAPAVKAEKAKPDPKLFYDDKGQFKAFEYAEELAAYSASKAVEDDRKNQADERRKAEAAQAEAVARSRVQETIKKHPDFEQVMADSPLRTHNAVLEYLSAHEMIGEISYYLAKHPDFVERINAMHPLRAIAEVGKLELTLKPADEPTKVEKPVDASAKRFANGAQSPPINTLNTAATVDTNTDPSKMTFKELRAYEAARRRKRS
jgi:hypothetical protein